MPRVVLEKLAALQLLEQCLCEWRVAPLWAVERDRAVVGHGAVLRQQAHRLPFLQALLGARCVLGALAFVGDPARHVEDFAAYRHAVGFAAA